MKINWILVGIVLLFLITRLFNITKIPSSLYWDEASIGYNAYSIGIDGKDEWGDKLPIHFRAFGEFKLPVYIYTAVLFVKVLGLNAFSIRLPSVLFSGGIVLMTYLIAKKITKNRYISLFSAFFIVVTPWLFIFSRTGYEATAGLFFYLIALYFYLLSLTNPKWFLMTTLSLIVSMYSYNSFRVLSILTLLPFFVYLLWINKRNMKKYLFIFLVSMVLFTVSWIPIYRLYKYDTGGTRLTSVGLSGTTTQKLISFGTNYLKHYSYNFLFNVGDTNLRSQMPGFGQIYWISLLFLILGILYLLKNRSFGGFLILYLLLISPIPGALTRESPHALRSISAIPFFAITTGAGLTYLTEKFRKYNHIITYFSVFMFLICFGFYLNKYFTLYPIISSDEWQLPYKEIFQEYERNPKKDGKVVITDKYGQPYIFALYYLKINPNDFRQTVKYNPPDKWGFSLVSSFSNFEFK